MNTFKFLSSLRIHHIKYQAYLYSNNADWFQTLKNVTCVPWSSFDVVMYNYNVNTALPAMSPLPQSIDNYDTSNNKEPV